MQAETTVLDIAHAAMEEAPEDAGARLRFYGRLAEAELYLLIESDEGAALAPVVFTLEDGPFVMAFDREDRLAAFAGAPSPYAAIPGRAIVQRLAGQGIGLGLNLGVAPSAFLMPAGAVDWLAATLAAAPDAAAARPLRLEPPSDRAEALVQALAPRFSGLRGMAEAAVLVRAVHAGGAAAPALAVIGVPAAAREAVARAMAEAMVFAAGADAPAILFLAPGDPLAAEALACGRAIPLGPAATPEPARAPVPPGSDPDRPPILR